MDFIDNLRIGKTIEDGEQVLGALKRGMPVDGIYLICIRLSYSLANNLLEIINSEYIHKMGLSKNNYKIIALAFGRQEAYDMVKELIEDFYISNSNGNSNNNSGCNFKNFKGWCLNEGN